MKILFIADSSPVNPASGSERVLYKQSTGMCQKDQDVCIISRKNDISEDVGYNHIDGVQEACYSANIQKSFSFFKSLFREAPRLFDKFAASQSFDAAVSHQPFTCFPLLVSGRLTDVPLIYVFHSPNHEEYLIANQNGGPDHFQAKMRKWIERFCLIRSAKIMVLSHYMKQKVIETHHIEESRIIVNAGGADMNYFKPSDRRDQLKIELGLPADHIHLLTVRNLEPRMGLDNLLSAIRLIKEAVKNIHLVIGGQGSEKNNLELLINKYGLTNEVSLAGFIPSELLPQYYSAADLFILPTDRLEGFGLVTTESLACGTPVLGTPVGGTPEILTSLDRGMLFDNASPEAMAEGILKALTNWFNPNGQYNILRKRCRQYVEQNYSWERHLRHLSSVLTESVKVAHINRRPSHQSSR